MNRLFLVFIFLVIAKLLLAQDIPVKPERYTPVYDAVSLLSEAQKKLISDRLIKYEDSTSTQIQIVIIDSLKGFSEIVYANKWASEWGIGQKGTDNGLLILISKSDRKIRIEVGYGLEDKITDVVAANIINSTIKPFFKSANYYEGINSAITDIELNLSGLFSNDDRFIPEKIVYPEPKWYQIGYEGWLNLLLMLAFTLIYNYLVFSKFKNSENKIKGILPVIFFVMGNALMLSYTFLSGIFVNPEKPGLILNFIVGILPMIIVKYYDKWYKSKVDALKKATAFILLWAFSTFLAILFIDDKIYDIVSFLPFLLYGFFIEIAIFIGILFLISLGKTSSSGTSSSNGSFSSSNYSSNYSSGYKSSSSSYKSSSSGSYSKSSYGGGSFGGGGASGTW